MCILCILIPIIAGLLCALLGYLLGKMLAKTKYEELENKFNVSQSDLEDCKANSAKLQATIEDLKKGKTDTKMGFASTAKEAPKATATKAAVAAFDSKLAADVLGKKIKADDLKIIEGIGPKIEQLFKDAGIKTWAELAKTSVEKCQEILKAGGERFVMHNPETWPKQSEFAANGKWKELKEWQDTLKGGRE